MKNKGFSLIEMIIFIVVFSVGVVGIMVVFYNTLPKLSNPTVRLKGVEVAGAIMDEILSRKFDNDTPEGGGTIELSLVNIGREASDGTNTIGFDDVDDYNNLSCITGSNGCFDDITPGYKVNIKVTCAKLNGNKIEDASCPQNYKLITVTVAGRIANEQYILKSVKANF